MYRTPDGGERDVVPALLENGFQAVGLVQVVSEQEKPVTPVDVSLEILAHKVKILMEERLQRCVELHLCLCIGIAAYLPVPDTLRETFNFFGRHKFRHLGEFLLG